MPEGFVYLRDTDPTILQDMRYATANNFVGKKVPGYEAPECVLVRQAADALAAVQAELRGKHLTLKVYDCYRPARAVKAFVDWAKLPRRSQSEVHLLSRAGKARLVSGLYRDGLGPFPWRHGRPHPGAARRDRRAHAAPDRGRDPCTPASGMRAPDRSIDMGTSFDCFDVKANTDAAGLTPKQRQNRAMLVETMRRHGFKNYEKEWWHYTLEGEPYPGTIFGFPIAPRERSEPQQGTKK
ncbi:MAG: M15 family metallopeptidase [Methyloceanibacter sp.]